MDESSWETRQSERKAEMALVLCLLPSMLVTAQAPVLALQGPAAALGFLICTVGVTAALTSVGCGEV